MPEIMAGALQSIITLKDGCLTTFSEEMQLLRATAPKCIVYRADKTSKTALEYLCLSYLTMVTHQGTPT